MGTAADPRRDEALAHFSRGKRVFEVAQEMGLPRSTVQGWHEHWKRRPQPVAKDDIKDMEIAALRSKLKQAEQLRPVVTPAYAAPASSSPEARWKAAELENAEHIKKSLLMAEFSVELPPEPIAISFVSDQHISVGNSVDLQKMREDAELIAGADGCYAVLGGDGCDNHIKHRAAVLAARSQPQEQFELFEWYLSIFAHRVLVAISGNHCLDVATEVATKRGWLSVFELLPQDEVWGLEESGFGSWQPINHVIVLDSPGHLNVLGCQSVSLAVTDDHRMLYRPRKQTGIGKLTATSWSEMPTGRLYFQVSSFNDSPECCDVTDDEIRLSAWILTDGWIRKSKYRDIGIAQRREKMPLVTAILDRLGYDYKLVTRTRRQDLICGRKLLTQDVQQEVRIPAVYRNKIHRYLPNKDGLPQWVGNLSRRQFKVFLDSLIDGDGTRTKPGKAVVLYGKKCFLDLVQMQCARNGFSAWLKEYRPGDWKLNITDRQHVEFDNVPTRWTREQHSGKVWCLNVPLGNFLIRRNGRPCFTGNCLWTNQIAGVDVMGDLHRRQRVCYAPDEALLGLKLGEQPYRIGMRHQYRLNSSFNYSHAPKQWMRLDEDVDIGCIGHHHVGCVEPVYIHGIEKWACRPGSYQITSAYSRQYGFGKTRPTCPTFVLFPDHRHIVGFHRLEDGLVYLKAVRGN